MHRVLVSQLSLACCTQVRRWPRTTPTHFSSGNLAHSLSFCNNRSFWSRKKHFSDPNPNSAQAEHLISSLSSRPPPSDPNAALAARLAQKAVEEDSPRGKTILGSFYREGIVVERDPNKALRLFEEAALAGDPIAQCSFAHLQLLLLDKEMNNIDLVPDVSVAVDSEGSEKASVVTLKTSDGAPITATTPAQLVRKVRKERRQSGFSDAQSVEFEQFRQQKNEEERKEIRNKAHEWLEKSIEQGNHTAMMVLANDIFEDDAKRSLELYQRVAKEVRSAEAYFNIGLMFEQGVGGTGIDLKLSFKNFSMAAQLGDPSAQFYMGHLYRTGNFVVQQDDTLARRYIEMAAEQDHPGALYYYALMHRNGECGLSENIDEFLRFVSKAAKAGHGPAMSCLAEMYFKGECDMPKDYKRALDLYIQAGQHGDFDALCSAGSMYFNGRGVEQDYHRAFQLYQDAMVKGSIPAMRNIASMYFYGHGVPTNKKMSEHFMKLADEAELEKREQTQVSHPILTEPVSGDSSPNSLRHKGLQEREWEREGRP